MPRKPPPVHSRFKPGQSGNPGGRAKGLLTAERVRKRIDRLQVMTRAELKAVVEDPKTDMIDIQIASILMRAAKDGDYSRFNGLLDRLIGKVKDVVDMNVKPYVIERLDGTTIELGTQALEDGAGEQGEDTEGE